MAATLVGAADGCGPSRLIGFRRPPVLVGIVCGSLPQSRQGQWALTIFEAGQGSRRTTPWPLPGLELAQCRPQSPAFTGGEIDTETLPHSVADAELEL